jgi:hypothetical protein
LSAAVTFLVALVMGGAAAGLGWRASRRAPLRLRWDGQQWYLGPAAGAIDEDAVGHPRPMIDLGPWLMVAFESSRPPAGRSWLPLQRRGLEHDWHALRCALYAVQAEGASGAGEPGRGGAARQRIE